SILWRQARGIDRGKSQRAAPALVIARHPDEACAAADAVDRQALLDRAGKVADAVDQQALLRALALGHDLQAPAVEHLQHKVAPVRQLTVGAPAGGRHLDDLRRLAEFVCVGLNVVLGLGGAEERRLLKAVDVEDGPAGIAQDREGRGERPAPLAVMAGLLAPGQAVELVAWRALVVTVGAAAGPHPAAEDEPLDRVDRTPSSG